MAARTRSSPPPRTSKLNRQPVCQRSILGVAPPGRHGAGVGLAGGAGLVELPAVAVEPADTGELEGGLRAAVVEAAAVGVRLDAHVLGHGGAEIRAEEQAGGLIDGRGVGGVHAALVVGVVAGQAGGVGGHVEVAGHDLEAWDLVGAEALLLLEQQQGRALAHGVGGRVAGPVAERAGLEIGVAGAVALVDADVRQSVQRADELRRADGRGVEGVLRHAEHPRRGLAAQALHVQADQGLRLGGREAIVPFVVHGGLGAHVDRAVGGGRDGDGRGDGGCLAERVHGAVDDEHRSAIQVQDLVLGVDLKDEGGGRDEVGVVYADHHHAGGVALRRDELRSNRGGGRGDGGRGGGRRRRGRRGGLRLGVRGGGRVALEVVARAADHDVQGVRGVAVDVVARGQRQGEALGGVEHVVDHEHVRPVTVLGGVAGGGGHGGRRGGAGVGAQADPAAAGQGEAQQGEGQGAKEEGTHLGFSLC